MAPAEDAPVWEVVGGADRGGIIVRLGPDLASEQAPTRLACGALVSEQALAGDRLQYQLLAGSGPASGWVSVRLRGKDLLVRVAKADEQRSPASRRPDAGRAGAGAAEAGAGVAAGARAGAPATGAARAAGAAAGTAALRPTAPAAPAALAAPSAKPVGSAAAPAAPGGAGGGGKFAALSEMDLRKACKEYGFTPGMLEERAAAAALLEQIERVDRAGVAELKNSIRKRGFATTAGMVKEDMVQRLRDIMLWESFRVGELRRVLRELELPLPGDTEIAREQLLRLLADATWQLRGVPVWRLPSEIMAFGVLDQLDVLEAKGLEELAWQCDKRGLPVEDEPELEVLLDRLRTALVWDHLPLDELRRECEAMGVPAEMWAPDGQPAGPAAEGGGRGFMWRGAANTADREERQELVRRLSELFWQAPPAPPASGLLPEDDPGFAEQVAAYLEIMQLPPTAGTAELKRAYKELARKHHPDKNLGAEEQVTADFQAVSEAYEALAEYMRRRGL